MPGALSSLSLKRFLSLFAPLLALAGCSASQPPKRPVLATQPSPLFTPPALQPTTASPGKLPAIMLGVDVLEAEGFAVVKGKRLGLLTHPAGVNRRGVSTIEVLRRAPGVKLAALFAPEHGVYGDVRAEVNFGDSTDKRTGLPVYSVYSAPGRRPTKAMLKGLDAVVVDLQDIGTRSYTFSSAMKRMMEGCFLHGVEVIVLDRPNPLGGLKVDGPLIDTQLLPNNYVGAFSVPYVHGLTIGELAQMAKDLRPPAGLEIPESARIKGKLTVVPMRGWKRSMHWPETGLTWVPTSQYIQDFAAVQGYPMVGLGTYTNRTESFDIGLDHGVGRNYHFRGLSSRISRPDAFERELRNLNLPGIRFIRVSAPDANGKPAIGMYVEIYDYDTWRPVELNFHLMRIACKLNPQNPFKTAKGFTGFLKHMGSSEFLAALQRDGARTDVESFVRRWREQAAVYQQQSKKYWLYR